MIYYTGDIHGSAKGIVAFAQHYELTESDIIVILGDVGANYYGNRRDRYCKDALAKIKPTVFCVHGNHERRPDTLAGYKQKEWNGGLVWYEDEYPNLLFARDGDIFTMEGTRHLDGIEEKVDYKAWLCGHWHIEKQIDKLRFLFHDVVSLEMIKRGFK